MIDNNYKYDEFTYVSNILKKGFQTPHQYTELCLIASYCRDVLDMKPQAQKEYLINFCKEHIEDFNYVLWYKRINNVMNFSNKKIPLVTVPYIDIYEGELSYINSLDLEYDYKKVLFTFLVYMKLDYHYRLLRQGKDYKNKIFRGGKEKYNHIKKIANITSKFSVYADALPVLNQKGHIKALYNGKIALEYFDHCSESGEKVIQIKDYNNIGWYYDYYNEKPNIKLCSECDQPFKRSANSQMFCKPCSEAMKSKNNLIRKQKQRVLFNMIE